MILCGARPGRASRMDRVIYGRRMREVVSLPRACWNVEWPGGRGNIFTRRASRYSAVGTYISISRVEIIIMYADVRPKKPTLLPDREVTTHKCEPIINNIFETKTVYTLPPR